MVHLFNIRINRDASGKVVPNRKISIVDKSQMLNAFYETINILLTKFNPLEYIFFNSPDEWDTENDTYTFLDGLLSIA